MSVLQVLVNLKHTHRQKSYSLQIPKYFMLTTFEQTVYTKQNAYTAVTASD